MNVSFGESPTRRWTDARRYGFVSGGGGEWYSKTLAQLTPGLRVWVHVPGEGYVGVGEVTGEMMPVEEFRVDIDGDKIRLLDAQLDATEMDKHVGDPELDEYVVPIRWIETRPLEEAVWETGFFANQNTVCKLRRPELIPRLEEIFGVTR